MAVEVTPRRLKTYWPIYLLVALPLGLVLTFNYFPIFNGFVHIFYRWDGDTIEEFVGLDNIRRAIGDMSLWRSFGVVLIFILANLVKMIPPIFTAIILHHVINERWQYAYRVAFVIPMIVPYIVIILMWKFFYEPVGGALNLLLRHGGLLEPTASIQWLSNKLLVIPAIIFHGFPWVGAFGVLIYLAGLQNISRDIYESSEIDGANPLHIFWFIEMPLITTQIRINLVLMIINTIRGWEYVYLFLGEDGGPGGVATVPGLLIFREAFSRGFFGYGCAIGFLIFLITLGLTWVNNRYVRVDK